MVPHEQLMKACGRRASGKGLGCFMVTTLSAWELLFPAQFLSHTLLSLQKGDNMKINLREGLH